MNTIFSKSSMLLAACITFSVAVKAQQPSAPSKTGTHINTRTGKEHISIDHNDQTYELEFIDGKMTAFSIDGTAVPPEKWGEYDTAISEIKEQIKRDRIQAEQDRKQAERDRQQANRDRLQAQKDRQQAMRERAKADQDRERARQDRLQVDKTRDRSTQDRLQAEKDREQANRDRLQADKDREQANRDRLQADKDREQAELDRAQAEKDRARAAEDRKMLDNLVNDLVSDKLINSRTDIHELVLNGNEMILNGQKQSDDVHKRYIGKYESFSKSGITYKSDGNNRTINRN
jgi:hypothetical protein